jgi:hypothetical protein
MVLDHQDLETNNYYDIILSGGITMENFENNIDDVSVVETTDVEISSIEEPKIEEVKVEEPKVEEPKVEEVKVEEPKAEEPKIEAPVENNSAEDVAIYTLRSLTFPGGVTIPKGYSFVSKKKYEKVAKHKAVRLANKNEIKTYLK